MKKWLSSPKRSAIKALTWRVTATLDTFIISWLVTGKIAWAASIAGFEVLTKVFIYYFHERLWANVEWGKTK
ncbi:DUF2061 domain-containing protein [bacterium]|nr:DUF2061 domain-containing protein [bacterium]